MATDAATLVLKIDSTEVHKGVAELDKLTAAGGRAEKSTSRLAERAQALADRMLNLGKKMSLGVTLPLTAFGVGAFNAAKDAAELDSAFATTFGSMTATVNKWADETGNALGRSTREMKEAANTFGIFFNTAVDPAKAAEMSRTFSVLAQDLASFFNTDTTTAIEKLRSGLSGETDSMRQFGVFLTEASVKAKALELGLTGVGNELTEQEKILARYHLILEQTTKAQGDVARTSGSTANQLREAQAAWEELQIVVGTKLLPAITPLIEIIAQLLTWFTQLPEPVQTAVVAFLAFSAALGPVLTAAGALLPLILKLGPAWMALSTALAAARVAALAALPALTPFLVPLGLIAAAVAAVYLAWKNWDKIVAIVQRVYAGVKTWIVDKLNAVWDGVKARINSVTEAFRNMWDRVVGHSYVPDMVDGIEEEFARLPGAMVAPAISATEQVGQAFQVLADRSPLQQWADSIPQTAAQVAEAMQSIAVRGFDSLAGAFTDVIMGARSLGEAFSDVARQIIADIIQMTVRMLIFRAIAGIFGGGAGMGGHSLGAGLFPSAKGNVFAGGNIVPFASGGVVMGPTLFPMTGGRTGMMGEAGPEAIMPLARDSRGRLGVRANDNQGGVIEVHIVADASPDLLLKTAVVADARIKVAEPRIIRGAANATIRAAGRRTLMGRSG